MISVENKDILCNPVSAWGHEMYPHLGAWEGAEKWLFRQVCVKYRRMPREKNQVTTLCGISLASERKLVYNCATLYYTRAAGVTGEKHSYLCTLFRCVKLKSQCHAFGNPEAIVGHVSELKNPSGQKGVPHHPLEKFCTF